MRNAPEIKIGIYRKEVALSISKEDWNSCWVSGSSTDSSSCYRSTLIIPITLVNNELSKEFVHSLDARIKDRELPGIRRIILGYLCLDHEEAGYFDPMTDVRLGYIFADILSVYLFMRYNYTQLSNTMQELGQCEITTKETLAEAQRKMQLQPRLMDQIPDELESRNNLLLDVDPGIFGASMSELTEA